MNIIKGIAVSKEGQAPFCLANKFNAERLRADSAPCFSSCFLSLSQDA